MKVLVVDDEPDMLTGLRRILECDGHEVSTASDGLEAIARDRSWLPDAVVMDIRLPRGCGIATGLEILRARPGTLLILMTGFIDAIDEASQRRLAAACRHSTVELLMKPLNLERLRALLVGEICPRSASPNPAVSWIDNLSAASPATRNNRSGHAD